MVTMDLYFRGLFQDILNTQGTTSDKALKHGQPLLCQRHAFTDGIEKRRAATDIA